ncbi:hypothetical protein TNCV_1964721 [Trichonephila clavipes]|nr:hypothetical protein TNCV_1964721 [Trichonephila clavipes]
MAPGLELARRRQQVCDHNHLAILRHMRCSNGRGPSTTGVRGIFDVEDAPRTCRPVIENVDKITEIIEVDRHLDRLKLAIDQKRPELANRRGVVFHQGNARPHTSVVSCQNLWELWLNTGDNALDVPLHHHVHVTHFELSETCKWGRCHLGTQGVLRKESMNHMVNMICEDASIMFTCDHSP